jgi:hypothetical protein
MPSDQTLPLPSDNGKLLKSLLLKFGQNSAEIIANIENWQAKDQQAIEAIEKEYPACQGMFPTDDQKIWREFMSEVLRFLRENPTYV